MRNRTGKNIGRRKFLHTLAGTTALAGITTPFDYLRAQIPEGEQGIKITGIYRTKISGMGGQIVRIETNKGITGYGECRDLDDGAAGTPGWGGYTKTYDGALEWLNTFAPHLVGKNPTKIEDIFNTMVQLWSGYVTPELKYNQERMGTGAISGIEMACWDIVGKVYNVPVYQLLGPRFNDRIVMYADTDSNMKSDVASRQKKGFKHYKCDMYLSSIARNNYSTSSTPNNYGYREITISQAGLDQMHTYMEQYRQTLTEFGEPYASAPIGSDHYQGYNASDQLSVESAIALANTLHEHNPNGYVEDIIDWWTDGCSGAPSKAVTDACEIRVQTGEDMFGFDQFKPWAESGALDNFHPEPNTFGGINETLKAAKYAHEHGIVTYFHNSSGPIAMVAYAHLAAATPGFVALEYHQMDHPWHDDLIDGIVKPMIQDGDTFVPEGPGLGFTPNEEQFAAHGASTWTECG